ncbi:Flp pilus assembly protein CpaB [Virgibacillus kekensis]|uniref:Flp pilus assembly protein CpaB n=1 Tax=Virgibacillus kekensis TaxID=202261 RepID=A0ABV9DKX5_9BACI
MLESKRKAIIFFLIAILLAALSGFLVLKKVQALNSNLGTMIEVVIASNEISSRALITPNDITTEEIPKKYLRDEHITNVEDLMNKVSVVPLSSGDIITKNMLKQASTVTEADNRLVTVIRSERVFFDEKLTPLDRVDFIVSHTFNGEPVTEVFMKDIKVARTTTDNEGKFQGVQLEVSFADVPRLIHMQNYADSLRVIKSNVGQEQETSESPGSETESVIEEKEKETTKEKQSKEDQELKKEEKNTKEKPKEEGTKKDGE